MEKSCDLDGNPDLYGLGVRTGVYCQILATIVANHGLPDALSSAIDTNVIFLLALLVAMIKATVEHALSVVEAFIMLQIILTFLLSIVRIDGLRWVALMLVPAVSKDQYELSYAHQNVTSFGTYWRECINTAAVAYNLWFWFHGINTLNNARPCNFQIFFFGRISGLGQIKVLYRIAAVVFGLFRILAWIPSIATLDSNTEETTSTETTLSALAQDTKGSGKLDVKSFIIWGFTRPDRNKHKQALDDIRAAIGKRRRPLQIRSSLLRGYHLVQRAVVISDAFLMTWTVITVELTLVWSQIDGVYQISSTSQLIPLVIGLSGLFQNSLSLFYLLLATKEKGHPTTEWASSSYWQYRVGDETIARFSCLNRSKEFITEFKNDHKLKKWWSFGDRSQLPQGRHLSKKTHKRAGSVIAPTPPYQRSITNPRPSFSSLQSYQYLTFQGYALPHGGYQFFEDRTPTQPASCNDIPKLFNLPYKRSRTDFDSPRSITPEHPSAGPSIPTHPYMSERQIRVVERFTLPSSVGDAESGVLSDENHDSCSYNTYSTSSGSTSSSENHESRLRRKHEQTAIENSFERQGRERKRTYEFDWSTARFLLTKPDFVNSFKALQIAVDREEEFSGLTVARLDDAASDGELDYKSSAEVVDNPFHSSRTRPLTYRQQLRREPWNQKRIIVYYTMLTLLYTISPIGVLLLLAGSPFIIDRMMREPLERIDESSERSSTAERPMKRRERIYRAIRDTLWVTRDRLVHGPKLLAHLYVDMTMPNNKSTIRQMITITEGLAIGIILILPPVGLLLLYLRISKAIKDRNKNGNSRAPVWLTPVICFLFILFFPITAPYFFLEAWWAQRTKMGDRTQRRKRRKNRIKRSVALIWFLTFPISVPLFLFRRLWLWIRDLSDDGSSAQMST